MPPPSALRTLLVDDHAVFRAAFASLLGSWGFDIVGQASDGARGIEAAGTLQPDLIFMDLVMPGTGGLEATRAIKGRWPAIRIVILTAHSTESGQSVQGFSDTLVGGRGSADVRAWVTP